MTIAEFIREEILRPRLSRAGCLVIYDPARRYREICEGLAGGKVRLVDASTGSIESREAALMALKELGDSAHPSVQGLILYVPARRPVTDEQKMADPFALYAECGAVFPQDDGDEYLNLCLRAKPDHATEIRQVFASNGGAPDFAVIDAIGAGVHWPQLRAVLKVESGREILTALLAPGEAQKQALKNTETWMEEAGGFLRAALGMQVKTRQRSWSALAEELWRYVLFSEFVFDLPGELPQALAGVPHAPAEARQIIDYVCDRLRNDRATQSEYMDRAEICEKDLNLASLCAGLKDTGVRDTFAFEAQASLQRAAVGLAGNDPETTRRVLERHRHSVWLGRGETEGQWELLRAGLNLAVCCGELEAQVVEHSRSQAELLDFYVSRLREADRLQREFEQVRSGLIDAGDAVLDAAEAVGGRYRLLMGTVQDLFIKHLETTGWPAAGRLANAEAFDRLVGARLKEGGRRVACLMIDSLRYELGMELERMLAENWPVELQAACAQLPTVTVVGMASLLPGAGRDLSLTLEKNELTPKLADVPVTTVPQRMDVLRKWLGDRFAERPLKDFVRDKEAIAATVDLLVLRSWDMDTQLEGNTESALTQIPQTLRLIRRALQKLCELGFQDAVILTDHGFFLNAQPAAGDVCTKPQGAWVVNAHDRMMLGDGADDVYNLVMGAEKLGIRGSFAQAAMPRSMAPYRAGQLYFHGGASLAEAVVPALVVRLEAGNPVEPDRVSVEISYRNGAKRITTRVPVIEVSLASDNLFLQEKSVEILLEAQTANGTVVGEPRPGAEVNAATRTISLTPGQRKQVALQMDAEFEGRFFVKALNPATLAAYSTLELETDYAV